MSMSARLEFKLQDMWIGVFWLKNEMLPIQQGNRRWRRDIWICILPMFPLHIVQIWEVSA